MASIQRTAIALCSVLVASTTAPSTCLALAGAQLPPDEDLRRVAEEHVAAGPVGRLVIGLLDVDGERRVLRAGDEAPETFRVGALAHVLTGALLAEMARRGEVTLDQPVSVYLPRSRSDLPLGNGRVTLRTLAAHVPGPRHGDLGERDTSPFPDFGIGLLGQVLAADLGTSWYQAVHDRVLEPLGMASTAPSAETSLVSTVDDLLAFLAMSLEAPSEARLGWFTRTLGSDRVVWHASFDGGHRAFIGFDQRRRIGVVLLADGGPGLESLGFRLLGPARVEEPLSSRSRR